MAENGKVTSGDDADPSKKPLLSSSTDYGSISFPEADGYSLSQRGLADIVAQKQTKALSAFGGVSGLASAVGCKDLSKGLINAKTKEGAAFVEAQRSKYGSNSLPPPPSPSLLALVLEGLKDPTIIMLLVSAVISLVLGLGIERDFEHGWIEGTSIFVTVCLVVAVASLTDYAKAKEFRDQQLRLEGERHVNLVRSGESTIVHPGELVVGDIIRLAVGDIVPVDGILIDGSGLKMDESALTGESDLINKAVYTGGGKESKADPFIVSGTNVMQGSGKMLVVAVGCNSMQGRILARIREQETEGGDDDDNEENGGFLSTLRSFFSFGSADVEGADLMKKLDVLAMDIGKIGLLVAFLVFLVMFTTWLNSQFFKGGDCAALVEDECIPHAACAWSHSSGSCVRTWTAEDISTVLDYFITAVTILVVAVPEGLPLAVTLALAVSVRRMIKDSNQVKHMDSCETMGSATTICSDKTGTLTENKMTAMRAFLAGKEHEHIVGKTSGEEDMNLGKIILESSTSSDETKALVELLSEAILLNCAPTSKVNSTEAGLVYEGNATECALIKLTQQLKVDGESLRQSFKKPNSVLDWGEHSIPFSSEKKRMSWIVEKGDGFRMYSKGAPKAMFGSSTSFLSGLSGSVTETKPLTPAELKAFNEKIESYQNSGLRSLAVAFRDFDSVPKDGWNNNKDLETNMTLLAVFGIEDPLRPSVPGAIEDCRKAGIDVRMCTGDALSTAVSIGKGCGILRSTDFDKDGNPKEGFAMTGAEFDDRVHLKDGKAPHVVRRVFDPEINDAVDKLAPQFLLDEKGNKKLDMEAFDKLWPTLRVLARCQPEDKLTLVKGMRKSQLFMDETRCRSLDKEHNIKIFPDYQVVAVTGDGTNDAPALKSADVGFAMGIVGTETAKQACDIILLDDNFSSIVKAAMWGRNVFDSISKFLQFQLTVNVVAITLAVVGAFAYSESPLTAVQMLWVNMIMDSLASLALATELPTKELLDRMPYGRRRPVISKVMQANIIGHSLYQIGVLLWVLFAPQTIPFLDPPITHDPTQGSVHWSVFFNVFVLLQLFNEFNSRRLPTIEKLRSTVSEWNVFNGVCSNPVFVAVMVSTFLAQIFIVQYGGLAVNLVHGGLTRDQWLFCVVVGMFGLVWQLIINFLIVRLMKSSSEEETNSIEQSIRKMSTRSLGDVKDDTSIDDAESHREKSLPQANWDKFRAGVRQGNIYKDMMGGSSFRSGHKLGSIVKTRLDDQKEAKKKIEVSEKLFSSEKSLKQD
uniref:P-type Ca(2+) transporter n=1 Tax=Ditylum brightwellii TaxID=49249 RepID=A0A7S4VBP8_9STRA